MHAPSALRHSRGLPTRTDRVTPAWRSASPRTRAGALGRLGSAELQARKRGRLQRKADRDGREADHGAGMTPCSVNWDLTCRAAGVCPSSRRAWAGSRWWCSHVTYTKRPAAPARLCLIRATGEGSGPALIPAAIRIPEDGMTAYIVAQWRSWTRNSGSGTKQIAAQEIAPARRAVPGAWRRPGSGRSGLE